MVREQDLLTTHTLIPPQVNRALGAGQEIDGRALGAHVVDQDDNGIVVRGARMLATIGPIADELLVFPSTVLRGTPEDEPYSFAFAINCDAPACASSAVRASTTGAGIRSAAASTRSTPSSIFDDVHVPWERVFMLGHPELCNAFYTETSAVVHMTHQVISRTLTKTETYLGLLSLMTEAIGIEQFQPHPGGPRRGHRDARHPQRTAACLRGRRGAQRLRRLHAVVGAAEHRAQLVSEGLPASAGARAQVRGQRPDGASRPRTTSPAAPPTTSSATCSRRR